MKIDDTLIGKTVRLKNNEYCVRNSLTIGDQGVVRYIGRHDDFYNLPTASVQFKGGLYCVFEDTVEVVEPEKPKFGKHLPTGATERKGIPIFSGVFQYFPDALVEIAKLSKAGNDQHNPGEPLHWARGKSMDQEDTLLRHLLEAGTIDTDGQRHSTKVAWRALAKLQLEIEADREKEVQNG